MKLLNDMINILFSHEDFEYKNAIQEIFVKHTKERKVKCNGFLYQQIPYAQSFSFFGCREIALSAKLSKPMSAILAKRFNIDMDDRSVIYACLQNALTLINNPKELILLFPPSIHEIIYSLINFSSDIYQNMDISVLEKIKSDNFIKNNTLGINKIKKKLIINKFFKQ